MKVLPRLTLMAALLLPAGLAAQQAPRAKPLSAAAQALAERYGRNMAAAAREMPADKFGYKPTPQQMSFGEIVGHVAESNNLFCANVAGLPQPTRGAPAASASKDALVAALEQSFRFCQEALGKVDESRLGDEVPFFGQRKISRAGLLLAITGDFFDHYAEMAMYLRLNGLLPPTARPRPAM